MDKTKRDSTDGLVLTRTVGESVLIGEDITVTVTQVRGGQVRLRFAAPPQMAVDREEVRAAKQAEARD